MPFFRKILASEEIEKVHNWLRSHKVNVLKFHREFSDVLPLATILKERYPKIIELNNYPKKNSIQHKLVNWETFNFKVLSKLAIPLNGSFMQLLASGNHEAILNLIYALIKLENKERMAEERAAKKKQEDIWSENDDVKIIIVNKKVGDGIVQVPQKMILYSLYEAAIRESQDKDGIIESYITKVEHLENIIKLKSERIEELLQQVNKSIVKPINITDQIAMPTMASSEDPKPNMPLLPSQLQQQQQSSPGMPGNLGGLDTGCKHTMYQHSDSQ